MSTLLLLVTFSKGPYLNNVGKTTITVKWQTSVAATGTVTARPAGTTTGGVTVSSASAAYHTVKLTNLLPSTTYAYTVSTGGITATGTFPTAPASPAEPFDFIVYGDNKFGVGTSTWCTGSYARIRDRLTAEQTDFLINTGDMVDDSDEPHWSTFFSCYKTMLKSHIFWPVIGNHEYQGGTSTTPLTNYRHYWDYPRTSTQTYYSFVYGNALFIALDATPGIHDATNQMAWLDSKLASAQSNTAIQHIFVFFHAPPYSTCRNLVNAGGDPAEVTLVRNHLENNTRGGKMRAVFNGHVHTFEHLRTKGIDYFVTGGGGSTLCGGQTTAGPWDPISVKFHNDHNFVRIHIVGNYVRYQAVDDAGAVFYTVERGTPPAMPDGGMPDGPSALDGGTRDSGTSDGPGVDGGTIDAAEGSGEDAGEEEGNDSEGGCSVGGPIGAPGFLVGLFLVLALHRRSRRVRRHD